jgi:hypothetical protein
MHIPLVTLTTHTAIVAVIIWTTNQSKKLLLLSSVMSNSLVMSYLPCNCNLIDCFIFLIFNHHTVVDDAGEVDGGSCGQSPETYSRIFQQLSCHRLLDAVELAESAGLYRMATLLSQIGDDSEFVQLVSFQLEQWGDNEGYSETNTIPKGVLDIYRLMGADPFPSDSWPGESILKNIGWMRALSMIFWYCDSLSSPDGSVGTLTDSLVLYDAALERGYVDPPASPYVSDTDALGMNVQYPDVKHGLHSLLQVFFRHPDVSDEEMEVKIINALRGEGYTRDSLDYRASYLVLQLLECMGVASSISAYSSITRAHFIAQLISEGCWLWAVFIALQIPDDIQRSFAVKEMVLRYAVFDGEVNLSDISNGTSDVSGLISLRDNACTADQVHFLVDILRVPLSWLHEAAACRSGYAHDHIKQVQHFNFAQLWRPAKEIVCTKLAPLIWTKSSSASSTLKSLLESMDADSDSVKDVWNSKSDILLSFLTLKSHVDDLAHRRSAGSGSGSGWMRPENIGEEEDFRMGEDLESIVFEAKSLLERVQMLNKSTSSGRKGPSVERVTLLNMGTYLFDLIDRLTWRNDSPDGKLSPEPDLYESVGLFGNSLSNSYPVLGDHVLHSLHRHSSSMLREAANRLSMSYKMSLSAGEMNVE